jgi:hypothetical protein
MVVSFLVGIALGAALLYGYNRYDRYNRRKRRRIPAHWPLHTRPLVNHSEKQVWLWLNKVMFDHQVLIKLPVTRFTAPTAQGDAAHWYKLLNGVYCTFTVCTPDGQVIGCLDVPGPKGLSLANQTLKHQLLEQCGIHYWVVDPANLPHLIQIRTAFLGEHAARGSASSQLESQLKDVRENLHAIVDRKRNRMSQTAAQPDSAMGNSSGFSESQMAPGWEQNSFVTPLDSRSAPLGH